MRTKEEIIDIWASQREIEKIVEKITRQPIDDMTADLCQDLYLALLEKEEKLIQGLQSTNSFRFYLARMAMNQIASDRSPFHTNYRKPRQECTENIVEQPNIT